jgi:hypothetical protein
LISINKIIPLALLTAFVVFCELPVHADGKSVITLSEGVTSAAFASPEDPSLTAPVHYPTNCLPDCVSGDPEDAPAMITAPIHPQKTAVAGQTAGRTSCCGTNTSRNEQRGIQWRSLILQELLLVGVQHGFRLATEAKTRRELDGPVFADWAKIIANTQWNRWSDGDKWFTSNIAHPANGAVVAWIYRQNDTRARYLEQDFHNPAYRNTLLRAFAVATVAAVLWKIGPLSEATIGHVGLYPTVNKWGLPIRDGNRSGLNDYVLNEAVGIPLMIGEDWLDKHVTRPLEGHIYSRAPIDAIRIFTSPTRSFASLMALKKPWFRENRN